MSNLEHVAFEISYEKESEQIQIIWLDCKTFRSYPC